MITNVPQFVEMEDKIVGPLTAKQLGWLALGGVVSLILWTVLSFTAFIFATIFIALLFVGLAFYRPYNQPLISFIISSVGFLFSSKMYIWKRIPDSSLGGSKLKRKRNVPKIVQPANKKNITEDKLTEISKLLDTK